MQNLFNINNPIMLFLGKVLDSILLNLLWFICCIPIVTAGASTTALYYCTLKLAEDEHVSIFSDFFHEFKTNFRENWNANLFMLFSGVALAADAYIFYHLRYKNAAWTIGAAALILLLILYGLISIYIFPLMARFRNKWTNMVKNSLVLGVRFLPCSLLIAGIHIVIAVVIIKYFTPALFLGEGFAALLSSYLIKNVFKMLRKKAGPVTESEDTATQ